MSRFWPPHVPFSASSKWWGSAAAAVEQCDAWRPKIGCVEAEKTTEADREGRKRHKAMEAALNMLLYKGPLLHRHLLQGRWNKPSFLSNCLQPHGLQIITYLRLLSGLAVVTYCFGAISDPGIAGPQWEKPDRQRGASAEATFTSTAACLRPDQQWEHNIPEGLAALISNAIQQGTATGCSRELNPWSLTIPGPRGIIRRLRGWGIPYLQRLQIILLILPVMPL